MSQDLPIQFQEHLQLTALGIPQSAIGFNTCTLESDHYVCVRDKSDTGNAQVVIIDMYNNNNVVKRNITADSAIMNPVSNIIALRAQGRVLQVFNLDLKQKIKAHSMHEDVTFWKWISNSTLGLVTDTSLYEWNVLESTDAAPVRVTDRHTSLSESQIISYRTNADNQWSVVVGISQRNGRVVGNMQLFSKKHNVSQGIEGHAAAFAKIHIEGNPEDTQLFVFANRSDTGAKLFINEIDHPAENGPFQKKVLDIFFPPEATNDFPVAVQVSEKYAIAYVVTKYGFIHLYDLETGTTIYMNRISSETIFTTTPENSSSGILAINRKGQILSVSLDPDNIIPYILQNLSNPGLAVSLASRGGLSGADDLYKQQFQQLLSQNNYLEAAKVAASSPKGILRTPETIDRLRHLVAPPGQISPILQYFSTILDRSSLNHYETLELARPVLQQNRPQLLEKWWKENKLESSEELGDIVRPYDVNLALAIYTKANVPSKVVAGLAETGQFDKILPYSQKVGYSPDYTSLVQNLIRMNPEKGTEFATQLINEGTVPIDVSRVVDVFMSQNLVQQATAFLLDALKDNKPEDADLQTRLLEINLINAPQVADAILGNNMFTHFDKERIAHMCEQAGLLQRALEFYTDIDDIKRVIVNSAALNPEWLVQYFGKLSVEQTLTSLHEMLKKDIRQNLQIVIQVAVKYSDLLGPQKLISLFEEFKTYEGLYYYLQSIVNLSTDPDVIFKYIQAAVRMGQFREVERICRDNNYYNPEKVKNFLKEAKLADQLPLIIVCDKHGFVHDLVLYLYQNQQFKFIEVYVQQVNPSSTPQVLAGLLDVDCDENIIKNLLMSVLGRVPIEPLVAEAEKRNRLKLLLPFLEASVNNGNEETSLYDALAKIYIDSNNNPEKFLKENDKYNTLAVGLYCEKRDPYLAFIAYEKGENDHELIRITNENSMFKHQARYLLRRADPDLWAYALDEDNIHRRALIDQVVATAVPESTSPEDVSVAVKAFMTADLPVELIELLEKIILEPSPFNDNGSLQNLLILTAIKADKPKVSYYIEKLDNFDIEDIAKICIENGLYEEAFQIFKKNKQHLEALGVLVDHIVSLDRADSYAEDVDLPEVWSRLAKAQLDGLRVNDAIDSYIHAKDPSNFAEVIEVASQAGKDEELVKFLRMARDSLREPEVDSQLLISFARLDRLNEMSDLLQGPNVANTEEVGDKLYEEGLYEAAKLVYSSISNWAKLASTLVHLDDYQAAVDAARKASSVKVWKQVNNVCIEKKEFRLAQICGLNLIVHAEELQDLIKQYEYYGYFDQLIDLLEQGLGLERAHMGMFTELAILYSKYHPEKMMEHLKLFWSRINIPKVIRACESAHLWPELVFLYCHYDEWDNAALSIIEHSPDAFEHSSFKDIIVKVANLEIYYKALNFYFNEHPSLLTDLLTALTPRIDVARAVRMFQKSENLPMIKPFIVAVQNQNSRTVNEAYHTLLIEEEDYKTLRDSVDTFDNYDPIELARRLEKHELIFFRSIAAHLYKKNKKWGLSISLSKQDKLFKDAIDTAATSSDSEVVEELLRYFVDIGNKECFAAMLYTCYDFIPNDLVLELSWRYTLNDYSQPYLINYAKEQTVRLASLEKDNEERKKREQTTNNEEEGPILGAAGNRLLLTQGTGAGYAMNGMAAPPQIGFNTGY